MNQPDQFVLRVYGIIFNAWNEVLITDEYRMDMKMSKFPGGGLQYGEGTIDCLRREFREECNGQEIKDITHYYTTDFFQQALFYDNAQLISIYYKAVPEQPLCFRISGKSFDFQNTEDGAQSFRWLNLDTASPDMLTFPVDRLVLSKLIEQNQLR